MVSGRFMQSGHICGNLPSNHIGPRCSYAAKNVIFTTITEKQAIAAKIRSKFQENNIHLLPGTTVKYYLFTSSGPRTIIWSYRYCACAMSGAWTVTWTEGENS